MEDRDKPIITMFEGIRIKLMKSIQVKGIGMEKYQGEICPNIMKKINKGQKMARNCFAYSGEFDYQIQVVSTYGFLNQHVVDLAKRTCTVECFNYVDILVVMLMHQ